MLNIFEIIIRSIIASLLIIGCTTDIKNYHVPNYISHTVAILSLFMYRFNEYFYFQVIISVFLIIAWHYQMGSADVKVLIPIMFSIPGALSVFYIGIVSLFGMIIHLKRRKIPLYIPITAAYVLVVLMLVSCG